MRIFRQIPEPGRFWIQSVARPWPGPAAPWLDLATSSLGRSGGETSPGMESLVDTTFDDLVYLPPVAPEKATLRNRVVAELREKDVPVLVQLRPGEVCPVPETMVVSDVLETLLAGAFDQLERLQPGSIVVWPLIPGITDLDDVWSKAAQILNRMDVECVQGVSAHLTPAERRRLSEGGDPQVYDRLFHGPGPSERSFAQRVCKEGFRFRASRPLPEGPRRLVGNRRLAGALSCAGDLCLRLGRGEVVAQSFFSAARRIDREIHDFERLSMEGNLAVVTWLDRASATVVEQVSATGRSALVESLEDEYLAVASGD